MGLGAPKRRNKLSQDPNNSAWTRASNNYGHKILAQQGWTPGSYLGAADASHSEHYTAANASHIRVLLREDNLGLGANVGKTNAETFGLSLFSGVLGRLNGKTEGEVQKQQETFRDLELRTYQERKYGVMGFVSGGYLVGDSIRRTKEESVDNLVPVKKERVSLKREAEDESDTKISAKKIKKSREDKAVIKPEPQSEDDTTIMKPRKEKKQKNKTPQEDDAVTDDTEVAEDETAKNQDERAVRKQARAEKRIRKEARRKRKEEKALRKSKRKELASTASSSESSSSTSQQIPSCNTTESCGRQYGR